MKTGVQYYFILAMVCLFNLVTAQSQQQKEQLQELLENKIKLDSSIHTVFLKVSIPTKKISWEGYTARTNHVQADEKRRPTFRLASITKMLTAVVVLQLTEEGRLRLDDSIERFFDSSLVARIHNYLNQSFGKQITIRRLLRHTTGLPDYIMNDPAFLPALFKQPDRQWTPLQLVDNFLEQGLNNRCFFIPSDSTFAYSDTNYLLLGLILEKIEQQTLANILRKRIFVPLDLNSAWLEFYESAPVAEHTYPFIGKLEMNKINTSFDWSGGGVSMTNEHLHVFLRALLEGKLFTKRSTLTHMQDWIATNQPGTVYSNYGLGIARVKFPELPEIIGHTGFYKSFAGYLPDLDLYITGTFNQSEADHIDFIKQVVRIPIGQVIHHKRM